MSKSVFHSCCVMMKRKPVGAGRVWGGGQEPTPRRSDQMKNYHRIESQQNQTIWKTTNTLNSNKIRPNERLQMQWRMLEYRIVRKNDIKFWICLNCSEEIFEKRLQILQKLPTHNLILMVSKVMICYCKSLSNPIEGHIRQSMLYFHTGWEVDFPLSDVLCHSSAVLL